MHQTYIREIILFLTFILITTAIPAQSIEMRYGNFDDNLTITSSSEIFTGTEVTLRSNRQHSFNINMSNQIPSNDLTIKINDVKGEMKVHGTTQRLSTSYLTDHSFQMKISENRQQITIINDQNPELDLGQSFKDHLLIGSMIADLFPILPSASVELGSHWQSSHEIKSLVGWSWAKGKLLSNHKITNIEAVGDHHIVTVTSQSKATLNDANSHRPYAGEGLLNRTSIWKFDTNAGRLIELSIEQSGKGGNIMQESKPALPIKVISETSISNNKMDQKGV